MRINIKELKEIVKNSLRKLSETNNLNKLPSIEMGIQLSNGGVIDVQFFGHVKTERNSPEDSGLPPTNSFIDGDILWDMELYTHEENVGIKQALDNPKVYGAIESELINSTLDNRDFDYSEYRLNNLN